MAGTRQSRRLRNPAAKKFQVWSPPRATVPITYAADLFGEARREGSQGILYGWKSAEAIRVAAARAYPDPKDPRLAGLEPVGIFGVRQHGKVFLTEDELERFETTGATLALVIAGGSAGFFARERDGAVQSIRSHQELACPAEARTRKLPGHAVLLAAILTLLGFAAIFVLHRAPLDLAVQEDAEQLRLTWTPARGRIEIRDGSSTAVMPIAPPVSSATYVPRTSEVEVRLISGGRNRTVRFLRRAR